MALPSIEEFAKEIRPHDRRSRLAVWEEEADPEEVEWFWEVMRELYARGKGPLPFTRVFKAAASHVPSMPKIAPNTAKSYIDARLEADAE